MIAVAITCFLSVKAVAQTVRIESWNAKLGRRDILKVDGTATVDVDLNALFKAFSEPELVWERIPDIGVSVLYVYPLALPNRHLRWNTPLEVHPESGKVLELYTYLGAAQFEDEPPRSWWEEYRFDRINNQIVQENIGGGLYCEPLTISSYKLSALDPAKSSVNYSSRSWWPTCAKLPAAVRLSNAELQKDMLKRWLLAVESLVRSRNEPPLVEHRLSAPALPTPIGTPVQLSP